MQRSWVVTIVLCLAASAATGQATRAAGQAPAASQAAGGAEAKATGKQATKADVKVAKTAPASVGHLTTPDQVTWGEAPPALPRGAQAAILYGDPAAKSGSFTVRLKMPDGYKVMPHTHPTAEYVTVLSGALRVGMSRDWQESSMKELAAGGFAHMPANTAHYVQAHGATEIQVSGQAPFLITYINPADDPRKASSKPATSASR
jgi:quercetin dioxygenase-like cupin family protein